MKETQRTILWIVFGVSMLLLWDNWQRFNGQPSMFAAPTPTAQTTTAAGASAASATALPNAAAGAKAAVPTDSAQANSPTAAPAAAPRLIQVQTDVFKLTFNTLGGSLVRAELLKHPESVGMMDSGLIALVMGKPKKVPANVVLFDISNERVYYADTGIVGITGAPTHQTGFTFVDGPTELKAGDQSLELKFAAESGGVRVLKTYTLRPGHYDIQVSHSLTNTGGAAITPSLYLQLTRDGNPPPGESSFYSTFTGPAVYTDAGRFQKVEFKDVEKDKTNRHETKANDGWIGMVQHYFVTAWIPPNGEREINTAKVGDNKYAVRTIQALPSLAAGANTTVQSTLYAGAQDQATLAKLAPGLDLAVDYGVFTMFAKPLFWLLQFYHDHLVANWGWSIVLLTFTLKAVFYYPSAMGYKAMAKMTKMTPRMKEIREKYADDRLKMNQAMMELYKTEKANPLGGCLPQLIQMPLFLALYWMLLASVETRNAPWIGWITDLAAPDAWYVLPVLYVITMILMMRMNPPAPDPMQQRIMNTMPFVFGGMFFFFPSGLNLYYVVNNILSLLQQWWINKRLRALGLK